ncbi:tektin-4 [Falco rusticolus]|uniref:tektin-4 n=1 Tax=Falco rusticolus TaxID=120794 RepID=UPI0018868699|nr:tektin-4 [Falco rusticolus]XP_055562551.1 tektin-4 [Falco cherrug]
MQKRVEFKGLKTSGCAGPTQDPGGSTGPCPPPEGLSGPRGKQGPGAVAHPSALLSQGPAPQALPASHLPVRVCEVARNTGPDSSSGLAMASFRTAKHLLHEWHQSNAHLYREAFTGCEQAQRGRAEAKELAECAAATAQRTQQDSMTSLGQRLQDIHFWKAELQKETEDLEAETGLLAAQKLRLERALDATEVPYTIATDNLKCRETRQPPDLVSDEVEGELLKEAELIRNIQELLKRTLTQAANQMRLNQDHKEICEMDWSDKVETYNIDDKCGRYSNQSTNIQFHPHSVKFEESASTPETWAKFSHDNIYRAEQEKLASISLRALIDNILHDVSEDLRMQSAAVNEAFAKHCEELDDAKHKLEHHLKNILKEIGEQEANIAALKQTIKDKEAPMKVAQTRLYDRSFRPNVELCRDEAQFRLISEVEELTESVESLKKKLLESEQSLRNLEDTRMNLEKEIAVKTNSIFIDRQKCMAHRTHDSLILKLAGYQQ